MALRFKKNEFYCWKKGEITECMVGLRPIDIKHDFDFRDRLWVHISKDKKLVILRDEGHPTKADSVFRLIDEKDEKAVYGFLGKKIPNPFASIFKTKSWRIWQEEWRSMTKLVKVEIETSHDFSGVLINSRIHSPEDLSVEIKKVATELGLELNENKELEGINIFTNRVFR
ncbi:MAG: hypothetical protein MUP17_04040 [candidate division Zixibacteria bacterium]|nr:hypothetical protein [candidate division Zixibacteria bacterium]